MKVLISYSYNAVRPFVTENLYLFINCDTVKIFGNDSKKSKLDSGGN
jgi:hypothetical protein